MKINKLSRNLAIASLLTPVGVNALGIGEIQLNSALNQNFSAEIPLIASPGENTKNIRVKLASPAAFEKAGVERSYLLSTLRFKPELKADGTMSVKVLSNDAIREPFLNFLVEVKWAEGRMLKEYIVLLDPPGSIDQAVVTAKTAPRWQQDQARTPNNQLGTETSVTEEERLYGEQVDPEYNSNNQASTVPSARSGAGFSDSMVVPKGAILWTIAEKIRAERGGSQEQMLLALFRNNPDAFYQNNINALNAGTTLNVPTQGMIESISPQEGVLQVAQQNLRWNQKLLVRAERRAAKQTTKTAAATTGQLKLAPSEGDAANVEDQVLLERLQTLLSQLELMTEENTELKTQVADLDAKIQKLTQQTTGVIVDPQTKAVETVAKATQAANTEINSQTVDKNVEQTKAVTANTTNKSTTATKATDTKPSAVSDKKPATTEVIKKPSGAVIKKPVPVVQPSSQPESIMESPWAIGSVIGALSLGLIGWQVNRRRKLVLQEEMELNELNATFDEKQPGEGDNSGSIEGTDAEQTAKQDSELGDSIFFSEYRATEANNDSKAMEVDHNDLDPLSEADVYVAYGRYQQAEELIQQALNDHPDRDEYKLKLLEIHHAKDDSVGFTAYITQLREDGKTTSADFWTRAQEIGAGFAPENLFGEVQSADAENDITEFSSELFGVDSEDGSLELNDDLSVILSDTNYDEKNTDNIESAIDSIDLNETIDFNEGGETISQLESAFDLDDQSTDSMDLALDDASFAVNLTELDATAQTEQIDSENAIDFMLAETEEVTDKADTVMSLDTEVDTISWDLDMDSEELQTISDFPIDSASANSVLLEDATELSMEELEMEATDSLSLFSSDEMASDSFSIDLSSKKDETAIEGIDDLQLGDTEVKETTEDFQLVIDGKSDDDQTFVENDESTIFSLDDVSSELVESAQISELLDEVTEHNTEFAEESAISELFEPASLIQESELFESELSDLDEVADKLDLARVYIDMEDGESARGILNEVIESGTDDQKEIARSMVQTIEKSA
jgi:pilus assembly protein FimV